MNPGLTADQLAAVDQGVVPAGWRRCPDCNGVGVVATMDTGPDLDEHERDCERCAATHGVVPMVEDEVPLPLEDDGYPDALHG